MNGLQKSYCLSGWSLFTIIEGNTNKYSYRWRKYDNIMIILIGKDNFDFLMFDYKR